MFNTYLFIKQAFLFIFWRSRTTKIITVVLAVFLSYHLFFFGWKTYYGYLIGKPLKYARSQLISSLKEWWETPELQGGGGKKPLDEVDFSTYYHNPKYFRSLMTVLPKGLDFPTENSQLRAYEGFFEHFITTEIGDEDTTLPPSTTQMEIIMFSNYGSFKFEEPKKSSFLPYQPDTRIIRECVVIVARDKNIVSIDKKNYEFEIFSKYAYIALDRRSPYHIWLRGSNFSDMFHYNTTVRFEALVDISDSLDNATIKTWYDFGTSPYYSLWLRYKRRIKGRDMTIESDENNNTDNET